MSGLLAEARVRRALAGLLRACARPDPVPFATGGLANL